jgi:hypothetical protein
MSSGPYGPFPIGNEYSHPKRTGSPMPTAARPSPCCGTRSNGIFSSSSTNSTRPSSMAAKSTSPTTTEASTCMDWPGNRRLSRLRVNLGHNVTYRDDSHLCLDEWWAGPSLGLRDLPGKSKTARRACSRHIDHLFARMQRLNTYEARTNAMTRIGSNLSQVLPPPFSCE